jgi:hypothetical protein
VVYPITSFYDTPLMVTRGFSSETFAYEAVAAREGDRRTYHLYYLGDFDHAGQDAGNSLREKLDRFADEERIDLVFKQIAVTRKQIADWNLPTREPKRKSAADKKWLHDFACELDAIPPDQLRDLVETYINLHLPQDKLGSAEGSRRVQCKSATLVRNNTQSSISPDAARSSRDRGSMNRQRLCR